MVLSEKTKKAQQALSDKFGVATFNQKGGISTTPINGKINKSINVGRGGFKTSSALNRAIQNNIAKNSGKGIKNTKSSVFKPAPSKATKPKPRVLSPSTIAAQQALSNQFEIPTFDLKGGISTIPDSLNFSNINVGRGAFKDDDAFIDAIVAKANEKSLSRPLIGGGGASRPDESFFAPVTAFFDDLFGQPTTDVVSGFETLETGLGDESSDTLNDGFLFGGGSTDGGVVVAGSENEELSFFDSILNDPTKLALGIGAIALLALFGGGKKRRR